MTRPLTEVEKHRKVSLMVGAITMPIAALGIYLIHLMSDGGKDWRFIAMWLAGGWMALGVRELVIWIWQQRDLVRHS